MFERLIENRRIKKFGEAIIKHDIAEMKTYLDLGVRHVDVLIMRPAEHGDGSQMIPAYKCGDPWDLAKRHGLPESGRRLLAQYVPPSLEHQAWALGDPKKASPRS